MSAFSYSGNGSVLERGPFSSTDDVANAARYQVAIAIEEADDAIARCTHEVESIEARRTRLAQHREQLIAWLTADGYAIDRVQDGWKLTKVE